MSAPAPVPVSPDLGLPSGRVGTRGLCFLGLLALLWSWSIWINSAFWAANPNYSYGWVVPPLALFFLWRRTQTQPESRWSAWAQEPAGIWAPPALVLALPALAIFPLEVQRTEYHQSGLVLWAINLATVALTLAGAAWLGGRHFLKCVAFPILLFLTAVPWPARIEQPLIQNMMIAVAQVVTELLLWLSVPVETNGAVLRLSNGTVGIVEACSGIRSLQSGLMVCLAVGELSMLPAVRRAALVGLTVALALVSNLARTFALCWILDHQGEAAMHRLHDTVGNFAMYSLYGVIWGIGQWLSGKGYPNDLWPTRSQATDFSRFRLLRWDRIPDVRPMLGVATALMLAVHGWYIALRLQTRPQSAPQFAVREPIAPGTEKHAFDAEIWSRLGADHGEQIRVKAPEATLGFVDSYHLFWKPSPMSKVALHHRPDICMPGSGWKQVGEVRPLNLTIDGRTLRFLVFQFERPEIRGLQLWGVWRNGQPVEMDYSQKLQALPERYGWLPTSRHMMGVELVSCFVAYRSGQPPLPLIEKILPQIYRFTPFVSDPSPGTGTASAGK